MTVQTLLQSALLKFGQDPSNQRFTDDFYSALNDAQNDFATNRSWGFLRTSSSLSTTADTRHVALPSDFGKAYDTRGALRITSPSANSGDKIELMPYEQWLASFYEDGTDTGTPIYAWTSGANLYLSPVPDATYTIALQYYKVPTEIADTSTAITVPTVYSEALKKMLWRRLQDAGYSSAQELAISDADIQRLLGQCARDDVRKYGGMNISLSPSDYKQRLV